LKHCVHTTTLSWTSSKLAAAQSYTNHVQAENTFLSTSTCFLHYCYTKAQTTNIFVFTVQRSTTTHSHNK